LWDASIAQARAGRASRVAGQRFDSLEVLSRAAKIRVTDELRNEAIASLALVDLRPVRRFKTMAHEDDGFSVDPALERYAMGDGEGNVTLHRIADGREVLRLPKGEGPNRAVYFSPDGRCLVAAYAVLGLARGHWSYVLWEIGRDGPPKKLMEHGDAPFHFSADGRWMATQVSDNTIGVYDLATFTQGMKLSVAPGMEMDGFHPDGRRLMFKNAPLRKLQLVDIARGKETWSHVFEAEVGGVIWRGDERLFAVGGGDHRIYVWDPISDRLQSVLEGHQNTVVGLHFTHAGDLLLSTSWDGTMRVWDPIRGTCLLTAPAGLIRIGPDDRLLAVREDIAHLGIWELADGRECRTLHHGMVGNRTPRPENWGPNALDFSPDGRLLASSDTDGVRLWDPATGEHLAYLPIGTAGSSAQFSPDGSRLMTLFGTPDREIRVWPFVAAGEKTEGGYRIGPPRFLGAAKKLYSGHYYWEHTGRYVTLVDYARNGAVLYDIAKSA
jgi:WD40 repeat protein